MAHKFAEFHENKTSPKWKYSKKFFWGILFRNTL